MKRRGLYIFRDVWEVFAREIRTIFTDSGVILIFFIAGFLYPVLYNVIYWNDDVEDVPVAVVDECLSPTTRQFIQHLNATQQVRVAAGCLNMQEARELFRRGEVRGIVYFPRDFERCLQTAQAQAHISLYLDMSSFLYFKCVYMGCNYVMLNMSHDIQIKRYALTGRVGESAEQMVTAVPYQSVALFTPTGGYSSFLIPAILVLIIHQTLFFGVGMLAGAEREEKRRLYVLPGAGNRHSILRITLGKASAYVLCYLLIGTWCLLVVPKLFCLPHVGEWLDVIGFMIPFLLATTFFSMFCGCFVRNRETGMVLNLSMTLFLLFVSGVSWPGAAVPRFWKYIGSIFPSTLGVNAFVHISSMGAHLEDTARLIWGLWAQTAIYFVLACGALYFEKWRVKNYQEIGEVNANEPVSKILRRHIHNIWMAIRSLGQPVQTVTKPVTDLVQPITKPIVDLTKPLTKPIVDLTKPVTKLTGDVLNKVVIKPLEGTLDSVDEAMKQISGNEDYTTEDELKIGKDEDEDS